MLIENVKKRLVSWVRVVVIFFEVTQPEVKGYPQVKLLQKCPMATKFGGKNSYFNGVKSHAGVSRVKLLYDHQIW